MTDPVIVPDNSNSNSSNTITTSTANNTNNNSSNHSQIFPYSPVYRRRASPPTVTSSALSPQLYTNNNINSNSNNSNNNNRLHHHLHHHHHHHHLHSHLVQHHSAVNNGNFKRKPISSINNCPKVVTYFEQLLIWLIEFQSDYRMTPGRDTWQTQDGEYGRYLLSFLFVCNKISI